MDDEWFEVVDEQGRSVRLATRRECHSHPELLHRVAHVLVWNPDGELFLQKRSARKDIQPGKWDTSVGGHLLPGETPAEGAKREAREELGIEGIELRHAYQYILRSPQESEWVDTYWCQWDRAVRINPEEIESGRFWNTGEIEANFGRGIFTPNFEEEFRRWQAWTGCASG